MKIYFIPLRICFEALKSLKKVRQPEGSIVFNKTCIYIFIMYLYIIKYFNFKYKHAPIEPEFIPTWHHLESHNVPITHITNSRKYVFFKEKFNMNWKYSYRAHSYRAHKGYYDQWVWAARTDQVKTALSITRNNVNRYNGRH